MRPIRVDVFAENRMRLIDAAGQVRNELQRGES